MSDCIFCKIIEGDAPATVLAKTYRAVVIEPLGPHVPGHALVIPRVHAMSVAEMPPVMNGGAMQEAVRYAAEHGIESYNLLTSVGAAATQTVGHLHWHVIPRGPKDGLGADWPWMRPGK